jgi:hypothetical protein
MNIGFTATGFSGSLILKEPTDTMMLRIKLFGYGIGPLIFHDIGSGYWILKPLIKLAILDYWISEPKVDINFLFT